MSKAIFARVTAAELEELDTKCRLDDRSRASYVGRKLSEHMQLASQGEVPGVSSPDPVADADAPVLFVRVHPTLHRYAKNWAQSEEVSMSQWIRGLLFY